MYSIIEFLSWLFQYLFYALNNNKILTNEIGFRIVFKDKTSLYIFIIIYVHKGFRIHSLKTVDVLILQLTYYISDNTLICVSKLP